MISIASGKGGVGKSFISSNLGFLLAKTGKRVILADMDVGGADLHILFGIFKPQWTMGDFLQKKIDSLDEAVIDIEACENLYLLPGAGDTLLTANPGYAAKQRLINNINNLQADIVILDIGAGTNYHALDFFLMANYCLVVTNPEPTAVFDAYKFIKLAAIRSALSYFVNNSKIGSDLATEDFSSIEQILELLNVSGEEAKDEAVRAMQGFSPMLLLNKARGNNQNFNSVQLRKILKQYVGSDLQILGEVPNDKNVEKMVNTYSPLAMSLPACAASRALKIAAHKLQQTISS